MTVELLASGSIETTPEQAVDVCQYASLLPAGMSVYLHHSPRCRLAQMHAALRAIRSASLEPVPHIAARQIGSRAEVSAFLDRAAGEAGVSKVLLIGGDAPRPVGPYADSVALLEDDVLRVRGIREVGLPGYPEGHARIPGAILAQSLSRKLALVAAQGLRAHIVTQFSFAPARVIKYCSELAHRVPAIPVYAGLAGPVAPATLNRYAQRCGVSAPLRALQAERMGAVQGYTRTDPRDQLAAIARHHLGRQTCNIVGAHLFSFGNASHTAAWINRVITAAGTH